MVDFSHLDVNIGKFLGEIPQEKFWILILSKLENDTKDIVQREIKEHF